MNKKISGILAFSGRLMALAFLFQTFHLFNGGSPPGFGFVLSAARADTPAISYPVPPADPRSPEYLRPTPDAASNDPYVVRKAAELQHDPARIFGFVRDEIGYEAYRGSLRGARGTLWSKAGNALDKASLMVALLRASNIPARYAAGTLTDAEARPLIHAMFRLPLSVVGCPPADALFADPENDPALLAEAREHFWVEFDTGGGFQAADPSSPGLVLGQAPAGPEAEFVEVPDALRHKVTLRLERELTSDMVERFTGGDGGDRRTVLSQSFNAAELAGKPISVGHFVNSSSTGALFLSVTTHTYSPYFIVGQGDADLSDDPLTRGEDYQEIFSNFPLANNVLTGVFLEVDVTGPNGQTKTYERTIADRIGYAARQNRGSGSVAVGATGEPLVSDLDIVTVNVLPGLQDASAMEAMFSAPVDGSLATTT